MPSPRRVVVFRALAVLFGLFLLALLEIALMLAGVGRPDTYEDPFVGFKEVQPFFTPSQGGRRYKISTARYDFFRPDSFAATKGRREFRIFCLGGSTVQGRPYAIETSFTTWLELSLQAAEPGREWQVVNCGGVSYASYRLAPMMREIQSYEPDLFILYTGHNEFLEDRTYRHIKRTPTFLAWTYSQAARLRTFGLLRAASQNLLSDDADESAAGTRLEAEVDALLDYRGGLEQYHRDDAWREGVIEHFDFNLRRMVAMAREANVPILLVDPVYDLRDSPPFKSENDARLSQQQIEQFDALLKQANDARQVDLQQSAELLRVALEIDDRHAGAHYFLARCHEALGRVELAKQHFLRAKEEDICPLRILEPMSLAIRDIGRQTGAPVVDARGQFENRSPDGIMGDEMLLDHVHPTIAGHQLIAALLLEEMERQRLVAPAGDWQPRRKQLYREHLASLDQTYYALGDQRLEGLRRWTQGRAYKVRDSDGRQAIDGSR